MKVEAFRLVTATLAKNNQWPCWMLVQERGGVVDVTMSYHPCTERTFVSINLAHSERAGSSTVQVGAKTAAANDSPRHTGA